MMQIHHSHQTLPKFNTFQRVFTKVCMIGDVPLIIGTRYNHYLKSISIFPIHIKAYSHTLCTSVAMISFNLFFFVFILIFYLNFSLCCIVIH